MRQRWRIWSNSKSDSAVAFGSGFKAASAGRFRDGENGGRSPFWQIWGCEMASIKVVGGSVEHGTWNVMGTVMSYPISGSFRMKTYDLAREAQSIEVLDEEKVKKLAGTAGWGLAGAALLGPLGAIGGMLIGGNKKEVTFACHLKNGNKFVGVTDGKTWTKIYAANFK